MDWPSKISIEEMSNRPVRQLSPGEEVQEGDYQKVGENFYRIDEDASLVGMDTPRNGTYWRPRPDPFEGVKRIREERRRQIEKGFDLEHDQIHSSGQLLWAALALLLKFATTNKMVRTGLNSWFRSLPEWTQDLVHKYENDYERALEVGGALIAAEIDRVSDH